MKDPLTMQDAEVLLHLVDQLKAKGATVIVARGLKVVFGQEAARPTSPPPRAPEGVKRKKAKTYKERLFGHLPKGAPA